MKIWYRGNPRLWYRDDLINHPELIPLEGQEIDLPKNSPLREVYPGAVLLTTPLHKLGENGFFNETCSLMTSSATAMYPPTSLFEDELTVEDIDKIADQWFTNDTNLETPQTITIKFTSSRHLPSEYWMIPAAGDSEHVLRQRPTPRSWKLQGSHEGKYWWTLDKVENFDDWEALQINTFKVNTKFKSPFAYLRLVISSWNPGDGEGMSTGLRRLWIFGNSGKFNLPNIQSPDPAFVYVVPEHDIIIKE